MYVVEEFDLFLEENIKVMGINNIVGKEIFKLIGEYLLLFIKKVVENKEIEFLYKVE